MKLVFTFIAVLCLNISTLDLGVVRIAYKEAAQDKTKVAAFSELFSHITKQDNTTLVAYKGASITLVAKHAKRIKDKKSGFTEGVAYVEYALKKEPNNIEIRFIRLGIQENTPKILRYKSNIEEDKQFIFTHYKNISSIALKKHIKDYILQSKAFSDEEKAVISQL